MRAAHNEVQRREQLIQIRTTIGFGLIASWLVTQLSKFLQILLKLECFIKKNYGAKPYASLF